MVEGEFLLDLLGDDRVAVGLQRVPGWSVSSFSWEFEPKQRGVLPVDQPELTNGFPFGLYRCQRMIEVDQQTIVWPADCDLQGTPGLDGTQFNISGLMSDRSGIDGDVIGVRQYRQGDSLKHIHWAKTAALGRLIVQERQTCAQRPFEVLVDLAVSSHIGSGSQSSYEWAIRVAASICQQLHRHQAHVELICLGLPSDHRQTTSNTNGISQLLDFTAKLPHLSDLQQVRSNQPGLTTASLHSHTKKFLVCTDRSSKLLESFDGQRIVIECEKFGLLPGDEAMNQESTTTNIPGIVISTPENASSELQAGWDRGVCYGA